MHSVRETQRSVLVRDTKDPQRRKIYMHLAGTMGGPEK